jgi:glycosyltransferase involved in cell wall biosynthesis
VTDDTVRQTPDLAALERELAAARAEAESLAAELGAICAESDRALEDLRRLVVRYQEVQQDSAATQSRIAAIRASNTWRAIEALRRVRTRLGLQRGPDGGFSGVARPRRRQAGVPRFVKNAPLGVNVAGYLDTESGMGEAARGSIRSLEAAGIPVALNNVVSRLRKQDLSYAGAFVRDNPHPFNLVHLNADNMGWFAADQGRAYFRHRYTIGYWFWELSEFREEWIPFFGFVDEVWAASEFMREAFAARSPVPVVRMPLPIVLPTIPAFGRSHFRIPAIGAVFLYMFDVSSQAERKNPFGAIRAFRKAAFERDEAVLVLKFTNAEYDRDAVRRLHEESAGLNVVLLDGYMDRDELWALVNAADCYLSPHRSEGFGLTILESMRLGKPVIATAYSGNMDFMTEDNSFPLSYRLVQLERDYGPYMRGASWADPDLDEAARLMRLVVDHPDIARARGERARTQIAQERDPAVTGAILRQRLKAIRNADHTDHPRDADHADRRREADHADPPRGVS